jgi:plastocyanin
VRLAPVALLLATAIALASCGSDDARPAAAIPATGGAGARHALTVDASEFHFVPATLKARSGKVTISMRNDGKTAHELVVLKTDAAPDALEVSGGRVSEKDSVGEISETKAGATASKTLDLEPGSYVYVCNIPGHYADGMRGRLTVG